MRSSSIKEITGALAKAKLAFKAIKKTEKVGYDTTKGRKQYDYAPLNEVIEATRQALSDNGLTITQTTYLLNGETVLETLLSHVSGEWMVSELLVGKQGLDPQSEGAALTYKRRYGMSAILCVSSEDDDDGEAAMPKERAKPKGEPVKATETEIINPEASHWCKEHQVKFFKTGKMTSYAHPVGEPGEKLPWCHEHKETPKAEIILPAPGSKLPETTREASDEAFDALKSASVYHEPIKSVGDLLQRALALGVAPTEVEKIAGVKHRLKIFDLEGTWQKVLAHVAKRKGNV